LWNNRYAFPTYQKLCPDIRQNKLVIVDNYPEARGDIEQLMTKINQYYQKQYENITLLGRSSAKGFFMSELLISAYQQMSR
jgi:hypothetical protein